jgi:pyruvate dehydrogenase E2 component (dihydrolipoamide acetyltransferase)
MAMLEGTIVRWLKAVGDTVTKGEQLAEAEADKTTFAIPAPASGVLASILVPEGEEVPVRTVVAMISDAGDTEIPEGATDRPGPDTAGLLPPAPGTANPVPSVPPAGGVSSAGPAQVVPAARRLAREHGIDLAAIQGTGPSGRITEADVSAIIDAPEVGPAEDPAYRAIPLRGVRGRIAERMRASLQTMAQLTLTTEADVSVLVSRREQAKASLPVTYNHLLLRACAMALKEHPRLNAIIEAEEIRECRDINIGIAVPLPDGLIVPVIRHVDRLSLAQVVEESEAAVTLVRSRRATPDLMTEGTFTISNLGTFGIDSFTPIINPPEVAILGVGRITERPVPVGETIAWTKMISLSLTVDHRAVDGVPAAQFLQTLTHLLGEPDPLFAGTG